MINKNTTNELTEAQWLKKLEESRQPGVDVRSFFTEEEINFILSEKYFKGRIADFTTIQRHKKITDAAQWLKENSTDVIRFEAEKPSSKQPNAMIYMDIKRLSSLKGEELRLFTEMCALADNVYINGMGDDGLIRISFGVRDVFK